MSRIILMAMLLALTVAGCNRFPDLSVQIGANLAPNESSCVVDANQELVLLRGIYDLLGPRASYVITPRIDSYIVDSSVEGQATQGNMQITSFEITIKLPDGSVAELAGELPNPYLVTTSLVIPASPAIGGVSSGAAAAPAIPASYIDALEAAVAQSGFDSILLDIRANGTTAGGFSQTSPAFSWPVDFCQGCLGVECEAGSESEGTGCFPGQDIWTYCAAVVEPTDS